MYQVYRILSCKYQCFSQILEDLKIPQNRIGFSKSCLEWAESLLVIKGNELQVKQVELILNHLGIKSWEIYYTPEILDSTSSNFDINQILVS